MVHDQHTRNRKRALCLGFLLWMGLSEHRRQRHQLLKHTGHCIFHYFNLREYHFLKDSRSTGFKHFGERFLHQHTGQLRCQHRSEYRSQALRWMDVSYIHILGKTKPGHDLEFRWRSHCQSWWHSLLRGRLEVVPIKHCYYCDQSGSKFHSNMVCCWQCSCS